MRLLAGLLIALPALIISTPASAQATRTWVSGVGDDVNPCSRTAPCKTFAGAISKTATNGEINCLDPAGFGTLNIIKSITIDCSHTMGGVLSANVTGMIVNGAGINVTLRGLSIDGVGTTTGNGVRIINAGNVIIDNVLIQNFQGTGTNGRGIVIDSAAANVRVFVSNTRIFNNNNHAIHSNPTGGSVFLNVEGSTLWRSANGSGIQLRQLTTAEINNTRISGYLIGAGVVLELTSSTAMISNSTLSDNAHGIINGFAGGTPTSRLYANVITNNTVNGLLISGGSVLTHGNNSIRGNAGNEAPTGPSLGTQ